MKFKILIISIILASIFYCVSAYPNISSTLQQEQKGDTTINQQHNIDDLTRGNIRVFKDSYIPKEYHPLPEIMVFIDLGVLILLLLTGLFFVLKRKPSRSMTVLTIITFAYLAFIRGGCICPVGIITNTTMGIMNPELVGLATLIVFLIPLIIALIAGRVFCTTGCPLGAVQQLAKKKEKYYKIPKKINTILKIAPIIILGLTIFYSVNGSNTFFACELDPYKAIFFTGQSWFEQGLAYIAGRPMETKILFACGILTWIYLIIILAIGYWVPRPFCRFICPYGVLLGVVSFFAIKRRSIDADNCIYCGLCQTDCPTQAITIDRKTKYSAVSAYDCIQCNKCNESCKKDAIM